VRLTNTYIIIIVELSLFLISLSRIIPLAKGLTECHPIQLLFTAASLST